MQIFNTLTQQKEEFKPIVPGSEPPRWNKCSICADNLVASMAKVRIIITPFTRLLYTSWH